MKQYNLLPNEGQVNGVYWWDCQECVDACGSLYPFITTEKNAIAYAKKVKKRFPNVEFELTVGENWGDQTLVMRL